MRYLILVCVLSLPGCKSTIDYAKEAAAEALREVAPVLKEAGADLAREARTQAVALASDLSQQAVKAWVENKGDIQATIKSVLATIPGLAADAGKAAAAEAMAKRVETLEGKPKADEFRKRAEDEGLPAALTWASGGGTLATLLYALRLLRQKGQVVNALGVVTRGIEDSPHADAVKESVAAAGGIVPEVRRIISQAKKRAGVA